MDEKVMEFWLGSLPGIGLRKSQLLMKRMGNLTNLYGAKREELAGIPGISCRCVEQIVSQENKERANRQWKRIQDKKIRYYSYYGDGYPACLRSIYEPPKHLFVKGELPDFSHRSIGIVGARECTCYGRDMARLFGFRLAQAGMNVISGMAKGIDGWAHQGALEGGGKTYAVLGCGVEVCYPSVHQRLYESIGRKGGILSEFSPGAKAKPSFFPMRNRIISGLSDGILVVEAREQSGSLITADAALEQGKDVFVVPGRIGDELSIGCNRLIRQGAIPVLSPTDILEYYGIESYYIEETRSMEEEKILSQIGTTPVHVNQITQLLKMEQTMVMKILLKLIEAKRIREVSRGFYVLN